MKPAAEKLSAELDKVALHDAAFPVVANYTGKLQTKAEDAADICIETLKGNLNHWLSKKNRVYINKLMGYHPKDRQVIFFQAIMDYLLFGVKPSLPTETLKVHFENVCKRIDEDAITLPAHSLMVKLVKKYGLFEKIIKD